MTVAELIAQLEAIKDKEKRVSVRVVTQRETIFRVETVETNAIVNQVLDFNNLVVITTS